MIDVPGDPFLSSVIGRAGKRWRGWRKDCLAFCVRGRGATNDLTVGVRRCFKSRELGCFPVCGGRNPESQYGPPWQFLGKGGRPLGFRGHHRTQNPNRLMIAVVSRIVQGPPRAILGFAGADTDTESGPGDSRSGGVGAFRGPEPVFFLPRSFYFFSSGEIPYLSLSGSRTTDSGRVWDERWEPKWGPRWDGSETSAPAF